MQKSLLTWKKKLLFLTTGLLMEETLTLITCFPIVSFGWVKLVSNYLTSWWTCKIRNYFQNVSLFIHFLPKLDINFIILVLTISTWQLLIQLRGCQHSEILCFEGEACSYCERERACSFFIKFASPTTEITEQWPCNADRATNVQHRNIDCRDC